MSRQLEFLFMALSPPPLHLYSLVRPTTPVDRYLGRQPRHGQARH